MNQVEDDEEFLLQLLNQFAVEIENKLSTIEEALEVSFSIDSIVYHLFHFRRNCIPNPFVKRIDSLLRHKLISVSRFVNVGT